MSGHILQHINDLVAERDALKAELARARESHFSPRVVVQATTPEEAAQVAAFLIGRHNLTVTLEVLSADVSEENKRLAAELAEAKMRIQTLQNNLLGLAGLNAVYAVEEQ